MAEHPRTAPRTRALMAGLIVAIVALGASIAYLELRGPSASYVDGYNFAVAFSHGTRHPRQHLSRVNAHSSCSVWSFSNAGGVPPGDIARQWRQGCEVALTTGAYATISR
jgi:hypothetical protein